MDKRQAARFSLTNDRESLKKNDVYFEFELNGVIRGIAVDVSLLGLGLIIYNITEKQIEKLKKMDEIFIKLFFEDDIMLVGVKNVWNRLISEAGKIVFKSGVRINIISTEDKLKLANFVERLRSLHE